MCNRLTQNVNGVGFCHMTRDVKVSRPDWSRDEEFIFGLVVIIERFSLSVSIWLCVTSVTVCVPACKCLSGLSQVVFRLRVIITEDSHLN